MAKAFDPYLNWLGIAPEDQPPDLYRLLGVPAFVEDADVIESGAERQMAHVRRFQSGAHSAATQRILNEISQARVTLLNADKKAAYDQQLRESLQDPGNAEANELDVTVRPSNELKKQAGSNHVPLIMGIGAILVVGLLVFAFAGSNADQPTNSTNNQNTPEKSGTTKATAKHAGKATATRKPEENLLDKVLLAKHTSGQSWRRDGKSLVYQGEEGDGGLVTVPDPINSDSYEVELAFTRHTGEYRVSLVLPVEKQYCAAVLSVTINGKDFFGGFAMLNGRRIWKHRIRKKHADLRDGRVHRLTCQVQTNNDAATIAMSLDGTPMASWTGPIAALSVEEFERPASSGQLAIYSSLGQTELHSLKLKQ